MTTVLAAQDGLDPVVAAAALLFGALISWNGLMTWRGQQPRRWARHEAEHGPTWTLRGSRRQYRSLQGSAYAGLVGGPGFLLILGGAVVTQALGRPRDWWLMWATGIAGMALIWATVLFLLLYFWVGVPDHLRPPCQRGWEIVDGELRLVRPEAVGEHPRFRPYRG
jgi:hypothetical protein